MRKLIAVVGLVVLMFALSTVTAQAKCQSHSCWHRVHMTRVIHSVQHKIDRITPYTCGGYQSVVPCYIINHESATSGYWTALNEGSSGTPCAQRACGLYQFLGWRVPWPVIVKSKYQTLKNMLAHHRMARKLWGEQLAGAACHWCY